ncbi:hypothetical protein PLESTM_001201000 [Pleodorina starrii]|nr:hypothetical protein PLESTM_001201000 [Pleodorina starrii]
MAAAGPSRDAETSAPSSSFGSQSQRESLQRPSPRVPRGRQPWPLPFCFAAVATSPPGSGRITPTIAVLLEGVAVLLLAVLLAGASSPALAASGRRATMFAGGGGAATRGSRTLMQSTAPPDNITVRLQPEPAAAPSPADSAGAPAADGGAPAEGAGSPPPPPPPASDSSRDGVLDSLDGLLSDLGFGAGSPTTADDTGGGDGSGSGGGVPGTDTGTAGGGDGGSAPALGSSGPMPADQGELGVNSSAASVAPYNATGGGDAAASVPPDVVAWGGPDTAAATTSPPAVSGAVSGNSSAPDDSGSGGLPMPADQSERGINSSTAMDPLVTANDTSGVAAGVVDTAAPAAAVDPPGSSDIGAAPPDVVDTAGPGYGGSYYYPPDASGISTGTGTGTVDTSAPELDSGSGSGGGLPMQADQGDLGLNSSAVVGPTAANDTSGGGGGGAAPPDVVAAAGPDDVAGGSDALRGTDGWPCDWRKGHADCASGYSCIPSTTSASSPGSCIRNPVGGNPLPPDLALPVVFYPLTNGSLSAWPPGSGSAYDGMIVQGNIFAETLETTDPDDPFPGAITCDQRSASLISIPGLTYGRTGAFTINLWVRKPLVDITAALGDEVYDNSTGWEPSVYEYMLTHANLQPLSPTAARWTPMDRNQVAMYLLPRTSPLYGVARAFVKDGNDGQSVVFLDSDGRIADTDRTTLQYRPWNLTDGQWHMLTISSQPGGGRGWRMYVDGSLAVQIPSRDYPPGYDPSRDNSTAAYAEIDGGDPMFMGGPLLLCGRYGAPYSRAYGGQLANLAVFDAALNAAQVAMLYDMVMDPAAVPEPALPIRRHPWYGSTLLTPPEWMAADQSDQRLAGELGTLTGTPPAASPTGGGDGGGGGGGGDVNGTLTSAFTEALAAALLEAITGVSYNRTEGMPCSLDLRREAGLAFCQPGLVCAPVHTTTTTGSSNASTNGSRRAVSPGALVFAAAADAAASSSALLGVCAPPASGMLLPGMWPSDWPAPAAHFPLTRGSLRSWPLGEYGGRLENVTWAADSRFGRVVRCRRADKSRVVLDAVTYGTRGPMAVNFWVRSSREDLTPVEGAAPGLQYVFSHVGAEPFASFGPNQVHLYIPEVGSLLYGISVRAILRDGDDVNLGRPSEVFVDSDGSVGNDKPRTWAPRDDGVNIADGGWHMITVSTNWSGPGYSLYVDGMLRGHLVPGAVRSTTNANDTNVQVTGGGPSLLSGPIVLCGRADGDPDRHFSGSVAALSLFDSALQPGQVAELYGSYQRQAVHMPAGQVMRGGGYISATATTGDPCIFPVSYGGRTLYGCITIDGVLSCPVAMGVVPIDYTAAGAATDSGEGSGNDGSGGGDVVGSGDDSGGVVVDDYGSAYGNVSDYEVANTGAVLRQLLPYNLADGVMLGPAGGAMPRLTVGGQLCVFPFQLQNETYSDCVVLDGIELCPAIDPDADPEGTVAILLECAPAVARPPENTACRLRPHGALGGMDELYDYGGGGGGEAAAATTTAEGTPAKEFAQCIRMMGVDACQTQEGLWLLCPPPRRLTYSGDPCQVPYKLGSILRTDCTVPAAAVNSSGSGGFSGFSGGREVCPVADGTLSPCLPAASSPISLQPRYPIRYTLDRQRCLPAGPGALSECADYGAVARQEGTPVAADLVPVNDDEEPTYSCEVSSGEVLECAPVQRFTTGAQGEEPAACALPYWYRGRNRTDCVWLEGVEACKVADGSWAECSPIFITAFPTPPPNVTVTARHTVSGQPCALPFFYQGSLQWDCVASGLDPGYCRGFNGTWEQCMPRVQGGKPRTTITGQLCQFPFFPPEDTRDDTPLLSPEQDVDAVDSPTSEDVVGSTSSALPQPAYDCVGPAPGRCLNPQGRMEPCAPRPRQTTTGEQCSLPFTFRNTTYYDCFTPPADVAAAALANVTAAVAGGAAASPGNTSGAGSSGNGSPFAPGPGSASQLEFCSIMPVAFLASELRPCLPLDPEILAAQEQEQGQQGNETVLGGAVIPPAGAAGAQTDSPDELGAVVGGGGGGGPSGAEYIAQGSGGDGGTAGYGNLDTAQVDPMAAAGGGGAGGAAAAAAEKKRRDLALGLGLGVGLPGLILLVAGVAALRGRLAKRHIRQVMREMRMDAPASPPPMAAPPASLGVPLTRAGPASASATGGGGSGTGTASAGSSGSGSGYGGGTAFGVRLPGFAGPTAKAVLPPQGGAAVELEMSQGTGRGLKTGGGGGGGSAAVPPSPLYPKPDGTAEQPLLPLSSVSSHSALQTAPSFGAGANDGGAAPPSQLPTGGSFGSAAAGATGGSAVLRPPRPAPPPPFPRNGGSNAFASAQLSPANSFTGGSGTGASAATGGGGTGNGAMRSGGQ